MCYHRVTGKKYDPRGLMKGTNMKLNIGENIRRLRRGLDMTQEQLADKLGVAYQSVSRWENGTTYPDMEFLPALAGIFGVTVDELIGMEENKKKEQIEEGFERYRELCYSDEPNIEAIVSLLRELRRDCLSNTAFQGHLWQLFGYVCYGANSLVRHPDVIAELRITAKEIMEGNYEQWMKDSTVEYMSHIEDDEHIGAFLDEYATTQDLTKDGLLFQRYRRREQWDKFDPLRQKRLFSIIHDEFNHNSLWRRGDRPNHVHESLQINSALLNFIHNLCGVTPDPAHPITGDGTVDIFVDVRMDLGIRHACYLASTGDPEGAFVALEDTVSMLEKVMKLEDGTILTCKSICLENMRFVLRHETEENGHRFLQMHHDHYEDSDYVISVFDFFPINALTSPQGWEWFDPIRSDPRYATYVERVKAVFAPVGTEST